MGNSHKRHKKRKRNNKPLFSFALFVPFVAIPFVWT
jgi:hypothetical protein